MRCKDVLTLKMGNGFVFYLPCRSNYCFCYALGSNQSKTLFVRGLSEDTSEETLKEAFDGSVNARIVTDRDTGASKG